MKKYSSVIAVDSTGKNCIFIKKTHPEWQRGKYNIPGGKIEKGENSTEAALREFKEETNIQIPKEELKPCIKLFCPELYSLNIFIWRSDDIYKYETMTDEIVTHFPVEELYNINIIPNLSWIIPLSLDRSLKFPFTLVENNPL